MCRYFWWNTDIYKKTYKTIFAYIIPHENIAEHTVMGKLGPSRPLSCRYLLQPCKNSPAWSLLVVLKTMISWFRCVWFDLGWVGAKLWRKVAWEGRVCPPMSGLSAVEMEGSFQEEDFRRHYDVTSASLFTADRSNRKPATNEHPRII